MLRVRQVPAVLALAILAMTAGAANAQTKERLPWFAVDLHAATVGLPQAEGWVPPPVITTDASGNTTTSALEYPGRNWGLAGGVTVYPLRLGIFTFGVGASMITGKGTAETVAVTGSGATATETVTNIVRTGITSLAPQISVNFGHKLGWSYISGGVGRTKIDSRADAMATRPEVVVPEAWNQAINFGGGAKWFMKPRLGASFDVRFIKLGSRSGTDLLPSAKRTQMWNISAGISIQ